MLAWRGPAPANRGPRESGLAELVPNQLASPNFVLVVASAQRTPTYASRWLLPRASSGSSFGPALWEDPRCLGEIRWRPTSRADARRHPSFSVVADPQRTIAYPSGRLLPRASSGSRLDPA